MTSTEIDMASDFAEAIAEVAALKAQVIDLKLTLANKETVVLGFRHLYPRILEWKAASERLKAAVDYLGHVVDDTSNPEAERAYRILTKGDA